MTNFSNINTSPFHYKASPFRKKILLQSQQCHIIHFIARYQCNSSFYSRFLCFCSNCVCNYTTASRIKRINTNFKIEQRGQYNKIYTHKRSDVKKNTKLKKKKTLKQVKSHRPVLLSKVYARGNSIFFFS